MPILPNKQHIVLNVTRDFYHKLIDNYSVISIEIDHVLWLKNG